MLIDTRPFTQSMAIRPPDSQAVLPALTASNGRDDSFVLSDSSPVLIRPQPFFSEKDSDGLKSRETEPRLLLAQISGQRVALGAVPGVSTVAALQGDDKEILGLFDDWNKALKSRDPEQVVQQYAENAVLLPTVSNKVRHNHAEIRDYFEHFLPKGPQGTIEEANVRRFGDLAINSGIYSFAFADGQEVRARYTFVYQKTDEKWKIIEHHSSAMPEKAKLAY